MGTQGNVEQAQGLMKLCDQLKEEREQLRKQNDNSHWQLVNVLRNVKDCTYSYCAKHCLNLFSFFIDS